MWSVLGFQSCYSYFLFLLETIIEMAFAGMLTLATTHIVCMGIGYYFKIDDLSLFLTLKETLFYCMMILLLTFVTRYLGSLHDIHKCSVFSLKQLKYPLLWIISGFVFFVSALNIITMYYEEIKYNTALFLTICSLILFIVITAIGFSSLICWVLRKIPSRLSLSILCRSRMISTQWSIYPFI